MKIKDIITGKTHVCTPETELRRVAAMMVEHDCGAIPVVGEGVKAAPLGIVTDRDIVARSLARGDDPNQMNAGDAMTSNPVLVQQEEDLERAMELMEEKQVRRLLVVDENDNLTGVVSLADVVRTSPDRRAARTVEGVSQPSSDASGPAPS